MALRLEIAEFTDSNHWRWRLTDADGAFLADHTVALDPADPKYQALFDLPAYLRHYSAPDRRDADERHLLQEVGAWISETVLGPVIGEKILGHGHPPIVVRVLVPEQAEQLYRDLKKDRDAAKADRSATQARLAALLREEDHFVAGRLPRDMTAEQQSLVLAAIAAEIVAADPP